MLALPDLPVPEDAVQLSLSCTLPATFAFDSARKWLQCFADVVDRCDIGTNDAGDARAVFEDDANILVAESQRTVEFACSSGSVKLTLNAFGGPTLVTAKLTGKQLAVLQLFKCTMLVDSLVIGCPLSFDALLFCKQARAANKSAVPPAKKRFCAQKVPAEVLTLLAPVPIVAPVAPAPPVPIAPLAAIDTLALEVIAFTKALPAEIAMSLVLMYCDAMPEQAPPLHETVQAELRGLSLGTHVAAAAGIVRLVTWLQIADADALMRFRRTFDLMARVATAAVSASSAR